MHLSLKTGLKLISIIALLAGVSWLIVQVDLIQWVADAKVSIDPMKPTNQLLFIGLISLIGVTVLPVSGIIVPVGYIFGLLNGIILSLLSLTFAATVVFLVTRYFLYDWVKANLTKRLDSFESLNSTIGSNGITVSAGVRFIPIPFWIVNTVLAVTAVSLRDYIMGTAIGLIPSIALLTLIGSTLDDPNSNQFIFAVVIYIVFLLLLRVIRAFRQ